jgi:EAL domain-containing protein (putative c-di-GMP-specific phosphodiesterase class I)
MRAVPTSPSLRSGYPGGRLPRRRPVPPGRRIGGTVTHTPLLGSLLGAVDAEDHPGRAVERVMAATREHLGMDVVFVSEFADDRRLFRFAHGDLERFAIEIGGGDPLEETYCQLMVAGTLDSHVPDTASDPLTCDMDITAVRGIGCYIGVPVQFSDGRIYGTLCCLSTDPTSEASQRDLSFMRVCAAVVADQLERDEWADRDWRGARRRIMEVIARRDFDVVFQPIVDLRDGRVLGVEALSRFRGDPPSPPDVWFDQAWSVGIGTELELAAIQAALDHLEAVPAGAYLSLNLSHETLLTSDLVEMLGRYDTERLVVELTEHARIRDYPPIRTAVEQLEALGVRLAIDDYGAGYAGVLHVLELRPSILKIDIALVREIVDDPLRRTTAGALAWFGEAAEATVVAEGVETAEQLEVLRELGITVAQGFHLARPGPLSWLGDHEQRSPGWPTDP